MAVIGLGLRQVQDALDRKADELQREFVRLSDEIAEAGRKLLEAELEERQQFSDRREKLKARQQVLADEINLWRERARAVTQQRGPGSLRTYLTELKQLEEPLIVTSVDHALYLMDAPPEEIERLLEQPAEATEQTPAGRLLRRARTEYDLRGTDPAPRQRAAVEFANRPGLSQDDDALAKLEAALEEQDPIVREVAVFTLIQMHRFRAMRMADLDQAHRSVQRLAQLNHPAVIPVLVEIANTRRSGFSAEAVEGDEAFNDASRLMALLRLVEWHTPEAQQAVLSRRHDRNENIAKAAARALELFPGEWTGPMKKTGRLD